jgi:hypothetical protein
MTTPVETYVVVKWLAATKSAFARGFAIFKRIATLEARVTRLEEMLL